jgi:hypothetical protein
MTPSKIIIMLLGTWASCFAQADFRFYVFDEIKNDKLHYEFVQDITIYDFKSQDPRLTFYTEYRIYGINQDDFTYTTEDYAGDLSRAEYAAILGGLRKLPIIGLDEQQGHDAGSHGWINLDGKSHSVSASPDEPIRKEWKAALDGILAKYAPAAKRKISKRTIEGETVKARAIDFPTLLKSPKEFDGKRIRLTGYYHGEFEGSSFAASEKDVRNYKEALWLDRDSTFADPKRMSDVNDASITAEGTFEIGPGGHMGLWMGELVRLTSSQPIETAQGGAVQPADKSDPVMPDIVAKAETTVDVLMRHIKSTGECFPDPDATVRFEDGRVALEDFDKYQNLAPRLSEGIVAFKLNGKWGACDKDGKVVLPAKFDNGFEFHEGLAGASEGDKLGFIDKEGKWVIKPGFDTDYIWEFIGEVCPVYVGKKGAVIDKKGNFVWKPGLLRAEVLAGGISIQTADGKEGFLDDSGKPIPDREPNYRYFKPGSVEAAIATGKPVVIPADKTAQAELIRDTIESTKIDEPGEKSALKIQMLVSADLDVNARGAGGNTALLMAADHLLRPAKVFRVLLDAGAEVNAQNEDGDTALHKILHWNEVDLEAVRLLIDSGISVTATNKTGDTAFARVASALDDEPEPGQEPDTHRIAAKLLLAAGADKWKDYMGRQITVVSALPQSVDPVVSQLSDPDRRDDAFRMILSWQKYRSKPSAPERIFKPLRHVVVCPQKKGPPIIAVFPMSSYEQRAAPKGHVILIDADGAIIPCYINANSIDDHSEFKDVNGDGVVDEISTINFSSAQVLHILPVTRDQIPALNIVLKESGFNKTEWSWRLAETNEPGVFSIELGPLDADTGQLVPKARYQWSKETSAYVGPAGGGNLPFMRLNAATPFDSPEYDKFVRKLNNK